MPHPRPFTSNIPEVSNAWNAANALNTANTQAAPKTLKA